MAWEPRFKESCSVVNYNVNYRKVMSPWNKSKWRSITVNRNTTSFTLQLNCKNEYDIAVTSVCEYWQSALTDSKIWNFKTEGGKHSLCDLKKGLRTEGSHMGCSLSEGLCVVQFCVWTVRLINFMNFGAQVHSFLLDRHVGFSSFGGLGRGNNWEQA